MSNNEIGKNMKQKFYTLKELAELTRMSEMSIRRKIAKGEIVSYKLGRKILFKKEEIDRWIESKRDIK